MLLLLLISGKVLAQREYHVAKTGKDTNTGTAKQPLQTISKAAALTRPGDLITIHGGTYRELIAPTRGGSSPQKTITYQAAKGENVQVKGSEIVKNWKQQKDYSWKLTLPDNFFKDYNPYKDPVSGDWFFPKGMPVHTGEVYLNGAPLKEAANTSQPMTWSTSAKPDSTIITANFNGQDPNTQTVEINVRPSCFYPKTTGINYITIRGLHFSQAATQWAAPTAEQVGLIGTNWSKGWVIENNTISDSKCAGITLGKDRASGHNVWSANMEIDGAIHYNQMVKKVIQNGWNKAGIGSHTVRGNIIYRCGQAGICGSFGAAYSSITGNTIYDIYTNRSFYGAEMGGIKLHGAIDTEIKGNNVTNSFIGIWLDWMAQGTKVSGNKLSGNDYVDFFPEVNHGPYFVENNQFLSPYSLRDWSENGVYTGNHFAGLISRAPQDRATPIFKSHTTELIEVKPIKGGGNLFIRNTFEGPEGERPKRPKMHAMDQEDKLSGYGLSIYDHAEIPVNASKNQYKGKAMPLSQESTSNKY